MSERVVRRLSTREEFSVEAWSESTPDECILVALTLQEAYIVKSVLPYAKRRINWVEHEINATTYVVTDWETLLEIRECVEQIEAKMVDGCVSELVESLDGVGDKINALMCICTNLAEAVDGQDVITVINGTSPYAPSTEEIVNVEGTGEPVVVGEICELANVAFGFTFEFLTERVLPLASELGDAIAVAIAATTTFAALSGGLGVPVAIAAAVLGYIVQWLLDGSIANVTNWLFGNAQEIVCEIYNAISTYGSFDAAADAAEVYVNAGAGISPGDKAMILWTLGNRWFYQAMQYAIDTALINPASYASYECGTCAEPPDVRWELSGHTILYPDYQTIIYNDYTDIQIQWTHYTSPPDPVFCSLNGCVFQIVAGVGVNINITVSVVEGGALPSYIFNSPEGSCTGRCRRAEGTALSKTFTIAAPTQLFNLNAPHYWVSFEPEAMYSYGDNLDNWIVNLHIEEA